MICLLQTNLLSIRGKVMIVIKNRTTARMSCDEKNRPAEADQGDLNEA